MMQSDILGQILHSLVMSLPSIVVYSLGIVWALMQMRKYPTAAIIVVISLLVFLLLSVTQPLVFFYLGRAEGGPQWIQLVSLLFRLTFLAGVAGMTIAVFCDRGSANASPFAQQFGGIPPSTNPYAVPNPLPPQQG